ncbi:chemotaxis response regulator protein-glutamate methylesterase [Paenibacillus sp.]|uniref:protein-glutamate methylesterase/protein-glutamine glutaminase n=1 Tax=Paenibacillus sp. TaxID=58172 RepID=UPI002D44E649|nr:chemotaxis response regulator protein-glutamate methylesterase [Paenibacillus sp.]HZG84380.1 chemotaxis response regulator protein-glutamate methylesterase [Paenibacillus sp.]
MSPYRILVVDDSAFMRTFVSDLINADATLEVVGTARNGFEAVDAVKRLKPDAVTMDVEMPEMTGLEALPVIMREAPTPVIMLSSSTREGAAATIRALELGAFDFVAKTDLRHMQETLTATLRAAVEHKKETVALRLQPAPLPPPPPPPASAAAPPPAKPARPPVPAPKPSRPDAASPPKAFAPVRKPVEPLARPPASSGAAEAPPPRMKPPSRPTNRIVAIGTSTGGPRALQQVLTRLPADFPAPVLIVQHMPPGFTKSLAQRLNTLCAIEVAEAEDGIEPLPGTAYIAPGGQHLVLRKEPRGYRLRLTDDPPKSGHRPSVDMLFESLAECRELDRTAVLMTGMGSDGAKGMKLLYEQGVRRTIAEDASSCIVYGMPRAAVELGCVVHRLPLEAIAAQITKEVTQAEEV